MLKEIKHTRMNWLKRNTLENKRLKKLKNQLRKFSDKERENF